MTLAIVDTPIKKSKCNDEKFVPVAKYLNFKKILIINLKFMIIKLTLITTYEKPCIKFANTQVQF